MKNGLTRTIAGAAVVALTVGCLLNQYAFVTLTTLVTVVLMHEFYTLTIGKRDMLLRCMGLLTAAAGIITASLAASGTASLKCLLIPAFCCLCIIVCTVLTLRKGQLQDITKVSYIFSGLLYIAMPMAMSNLVAFSGRVFDGMPLICFFAIIWCSDVGAYLLGTAFGQRPDSKKLCPVISPKKSWIGLAGGIAMAIAGALALHFVHLLDISAAHSIALAVVMSVAGVFGDLFESIWKRAFGVKDSGIAVPGHGGLLDRFDSTLTALPAGCIYMLVFNLL